jgi:hypothetical protein
MGGMHLFSDHNETVSGATLLYNQTHAIHWDTDLANITADSIFVSGNAVAILDEKAEGPITITNSTLCNSFSVAAGYAGLVMRNSEGTSVSGSTFYNNNETQVLITGVAGGIQVTNWETGQNYNLITENFSFHNNTVAATGAQTCSRIEPSVGPIGPALRPRLARTTIPGGTRPLPQRSLSRSRFRELMTHSRSGSR